MTERIKVPLALKALIERNNELLELRQNELTAQVIEANQELMVALQLDPADGWRLDMAAMEYVRPLPPTTDSDPASFD